MWLGFGAPREIPFSLVVASTVSTLVDDRRRSGSQCNRAIMVANAGAVDPQDRQDTTTVVAPPARGATQQEATPPEAQGPRCTQEHVLNCQFDRWYPHFKHCTPRSTVLELPEDLVRYLQADGVVLPKGFEMSCGQGVQDDSDDEVDWGDGDDEEDADERVRGL